MSHITVDDLPAFREVSAIAQQTATSRGLKFDEAGFRSAAEKDIFSRPSAKGRVGIGSIFLEPNRFAQEVDAFAGGFFSQPAPAAPPPPDPIAQALDQLANIFRPSPPPPTPPAPVRQSVDSRSTTVERRRVDFGGFAARVSAPSGSDFSKRRPTLGAGL